MKPLCLLLIATITLTTACTKKAKDWRCTETKTTKNTGGSTTASPRDYDRSGTDEEIRQHEKTATTTVVNGNDTIVTTVKCFAKV